jgi:hypothetical protein
MRWASRPTAWAADSWDAVVAMAIAGADGQDDYHLHRPSASRRSGRKPTAEGARSGASIDLTPAAMLGGGAGRDNLLARPERRRVRTPAGRAAARLRLGHCPAQLGRNPPCERTVVTPPRATGGSRVGLDADADHAAVLTVSCDLDSKRGWRWAAPRTGAAPLREKGVVSTPAAGAAGSRDRSRRRSGGPDRPGGRGSR